MKVAIIEDEQLAAEKLESLLNEINSEVEVIAELSSVIDSINWLNNNSVNLLFVDIHLSDGISFEIFEQVNIDIPIIFTTAYDKYAIQAFKLNSIDYLLKPIRKSELQESLSKYNKIKSTHNIDIEKLIDTLQNKKETYQKRFLINFGSKLKMVETHNIAFFWAQEKSVFFTTFDKNTFPFDLSLDKVKEKLNPETFFRINRKMIINIEAIKNMHPFSRARIKLDLNPPSPKEIETLVSIERVGDFKDWINR